MLSTKERPTEDTSLRPVRTYTDSEDLRSSIAKTHLSFRGAQLVLLYLVHTSKLELR